jgi:hypothetical protein
MPENQRPPKRSRSLGLASIFLAISLSLPLITQAQTNHPLRLRGAASLNINYSDGALAIEFQPATHKADTGLQPGEGSWLDRVLNQNEPHTLRQNLSQDEAQFLTNFLRNPDHYATFYCANTQQGYFQAVDSEQSSPRSVVGQTPSSSATSAGSAEDFSSYVVSASGKYLLATVDNQQSPPLHRIFLIETDHPNEKTIIGDDFQGKGFAGIYCSPEDHWLCVNLAVGVHGAECHLFKHVAGRRFAEVTTPDINTEIKKLFERTAAGSTFDAVYGLYWKGDTLVLIATGRSDKNGSLYTDEMFLEDNAATGQIVALSQHFLSLTANQAGQNADPDYQRLNDAALKAYERSLQQQLDVIYNLLLPKLDAAAGSQLVSEQRQWELQRMKKPPGRYERDLFVQQRINTLAARFLSAARSGHKE